MKHINVEYSGADCQEGSAVFASGGNLYGYSETDSSCDPQFEEDFPNAAYNYRYFDCNEDLGTMKYAKYTPDPNEVPDTEDPYKKRQCGTIDETSLRTITSGECTNQGGGSKKTIFSLFS